ncbi:MAG: FIG01147157: hypothetical protein [uncultured Sulfurovum sp.]|uniref:DUF302 domain-containing protein n=1 Tax=uncultured Sulfurovum sp. TaxID=269237 RepID=A0A6S6TRW6_9BACT|nr:MAG: FIG01147157: hypothetical protein [uncultured Sulfurovum sp.]
MELIIKSILLTYLLTVGMSAKDVVKIEETKKEVIKKVESTTEDIQVFTAENKDGKITPKSIQEAFEKVGFFVSANRDMNTPFKKQFKETSFDVYNLFTFYKKDVVLELAKKYENVGLFAPMSMSIYTKKDAKSISVSTLSAEAMAKIMKVPADEKLLTELRALVVKALELALPNGKLDKLSYTVAKASGELVTSYSMEMEVEEWEDEFEELMMAFEGELAPNGFIIAGQNSLGDDFEEKDYEGYDFYEVYSICKLPVIFTIAKTRPEAGAFAPCSLYFAKKKDDKEVRIAFPSVYNWMSSLGLSNQKDVEILEDAQKRMNNILTSITE